MAAASKPSAQAPAASQEVSLAQYAAVRAAVAEGFPLADVLAVEGLLPGAFARSDLAWKQRLAADPELLAAYEQELALAEDRLDRRVEPLAEDAAAWASFLAAFGAHPAALELLEEKGLGLNDVARLRRRWARRAEEDTQLGELLVALRTKPEALGRLRVGPRVLRPSRVADARGPAKGAVDGPLAAVPAGEPGLSLAEYAALCAEFEALPEQRERVLRRHSLADEEARAALVERWQAALAGDAALAKDFERLEAHHARRLEMLLARARDVAAVERSTAPRAASSAPPALPPGEATGGPMAPVVAPAALQGTGPLLDVSRGVVVPFIPAPDAVAAVRVEPKPPRAAESLTGTAPLSDIPRGPELPFSRSGAPKAVRRPPPVIAETAPLSNVPRGPVLPFTTAASGASLPSTPTAQPPRTPSAETETSPLQGTPRGPVVPFAAADLTRPAGAPTASRPTSQAAAELWETSLNLTIPRELLKQSASAPAPVTEASSQRARALPPSAPSSTAGGVGAAPRTETLDQVLPLAQYAALCAELAVCPDDAEETFRRYGLGSGDRRSSIDAAWKERLRNSPADYARWQEMYRRYHAHFTKQGTPGT
ncbi:hypothetical protein WMF04_24300 [Sorangium sp. So ce260]|uniref:hypothetical protein n=1 Tax=Sorangium sp. So ce260 TaxID=3133291 RepID=UPI003F638948